MSEAQDRMIDELKEEIAEAKKRIYRGWDNHMWNFENMAEYDEAWLLNWAGHPAGESQREHHGYFWCGMVPSCSTQCSRCAFEHPA